jgi:signal transduction histidine kinase
MNRLRHLGLQRRIMLYVTGGLAAMFGVLVFLGLGAIEEATQLVFTERLTTAYTTAGVLERDLTRVAIDSRETGAQLLRTGAGPASEKVAQGLLDYFRRTDPYPFFEVSGVWLLDDRGALLDEAGSPISAAATGGAQVGRSIVAALHDPEAVLQALGPVPGAFPFAAIVTRLTAGGAPGPIVVVSTVSTNSAAPYVPAAYAPLGPAPSTPPRAGRASEEYHLEVVDPDGIAVLGIGPDEHPGSVSSHFQAIRGLMGQGAAAALLHEPGPGNRFEPHVMAVVPLAASPFYVVLEQPVDVALALPLQLRERLLLTSGIGFLAALLVAWITTRRVVKPTEQLTAAAERMAQGDLASPIHVAAQDEISKLATSLEAMRQRLQAAYEATERTNRELESRVAERTARLGQVLRQTISAQEEERRRLARELHDETAQTLAALSIALDRARDGLDGAAGGTRQHILEAKEIATRLLAETRRLILGLRPSVLDDMGLIAAIRWYCEAYLGDGLVEVTVEGEQPPSRLPGHIEVTLFRIAQEAINNVAKHADARHVRVGLSFGGDTVTVSVADDGKGFDVERALGGQGHGLESVGLLGMQERVNLLNGSMEIRSSVGGGTVIVVQAPVSEGAV